MNQCSLLINFLSAGVLMFVGAISMPSHAATYNLPTVGWLERLQAYCDRIECMKLGAPARKRHFGLCSSEKDLLEARETRNSRPFGNVNIAWSEFTLPNRETCVRTQSPSVEYLNVSEAQLLLSALLASEVAFSQSMQNLTLAEDSPNSVDDSESLAPNLVPVAAKVFKPNISGRESISNQSSTEPAKERPYLIIDNDAKLFLDDTSVHTLNIAALTSSKLSSGTVAVSHIFWVDENDAVLGNKPTFTLRGADFATGDHLLSVGNSVDGTFGDTIGFKVRRAAKPD